MWIKYYIKDILRSNWLDIGVDDPLNNHVVNIDRTSKILELSPLDLIINYSDTICLLIVLLWFTATLVKNFKVGYYRTKN